MKALAHSLIFFLVLVINLEVIAQSAMVYRQKVYHQDNSNLSKWTLSTSLQVTGGGYIYNEYSIFYLLYGGIRYQINNLTLYGNIPLVAQNNPGFTQSGMMVIPAGKENEGEGGMMNGNNMHGQNNSMDQSSMMNMHISLGDFYLYGAYQVLNEINHSIDLFINPNVKFPTAAGSTGIGTGKFDFGIFVNARKSIESFVVMAEAGFTKLGDPVGINYKDPFTYGFGIGKFLSENGNSVLLYYFSYTKILDNYEPPRQVSAGLNLNLASNTVLSLIGSVGLSNYSPDFSISGGFNFNL
jgi:hypothetical protein